MNREQPDADDLPHREWKCEECGADNSMWDADCQYCDGPPLEADDACPISKAYGRS